MAMMIINVGMVDARPSKPVPTDAARILSTNQMITCYVVLPVVALIQCFICVAFGGEQQEKKRIVLLLVDQDLLEDIELTCDDDEQQRR